MGGIDSSCCRWAVGLVRFCCFIPSDLFYTRSHHLRSQRYWTTSCVLFFTFGYWVCSDPPTTTMHHYLVTVTQWTKPPSWTRATTFNQDAACWEMMYVLSGAVPAGEPVLRLLLSVMSKLCLRYINQKHDRVDVHLLNLWYSEYITILTTFSWNSIHRNVMLNGPHQRCRWLFLRKRIQCEVIMPNTFWK